MALPALATNADVEAALGRALTPTETNRVAQLLASASARFRAEARQQITPATSTVRLRAMSSASPLHGQAWWSCWVRLPQRPVVAVTAVVDMDGSAVDFEHLADDLVGVRACGRVDVTYDHGYAEIPAAVVGVVAQMAARALGTPPDQSGITQESIVGYSYQLGGAAAAGAFGMLPDELAVARSYGRRAGTVRLA